MSRELINEGTVVALTDYTNIVHVSNGIVTVPAFVTQTAPVYLGQSYLVYKIDNQYYLGAKIIRRV